MRAIITCVDYSQYLAHTLRYNHHHFSEIHVVTSLDDIATQQLCKDLVVTKEVQNIQCHPTSRFHDDGALFNKFAAIEQTLDIIGRDGWLCLLDADTVWPKEEPKRMGEPRGANLIIGNLYTPFRRMCPTNVSFISRESQWCSFPLHDLSYRQPMHFSGYTQIFHASDPHLGKPPWHPLNLTHAGRGDTELMKKWPLENRVRPMWEVLHLGEDTVNWAGVKNREALRKMINRKRRGEPWGDEINRKGSNK